jgi:hypothetical protein
MFASTATTTTGDRQQVTESPSRFSWEKQASYSTKRRSRVNRLRRPALRAELRWRVRDDFLTSRGEWWLQMPLAFLPRRTFGVRP